MTSQFLACDLGAESGRVMAGSLAGGKLTLEEVHRFSNPIVRLGNSLRWDILRTFAELKDGLAKAAGRDIAATSLSVDSWGVDYVWSGFGQPMLAPAYIYRDARTDVTFPKTLAALGREKIFAATGIQFMSLNTIYQLVADLETSPDLVRQADGFLCIADFLNFLFSGRRAAEESLASTTQLYNPATRQWAWDLVESLGFPKSIFPEIVPSGTLLGPLASDVAAETGLKNVNVIATCSHDTGAAVAAVPAANDSNWAFLSSGTWSLIGVELDAPLLNDAALEGNFTNEAGFGGTTRFLKNIVGLWILQECRREWARAGLELGYAELNALAAEAPGLVTLIDPKDPRFLKPGDMPAKIEQFARETGQPVPASPGAFTRAILESLALLYREMLEKIEQLTGRGIPTLHIVGGGSQSAILNQFSANATGRNVLAGPVEATAIGNILIQAIVSGAIPSITELRETVRNSFEIRRFTPASEAEWSAAARRFQTIGSR
jgi:rhamnulokinase